MHVAASGEALEEAPWISRLRHERDEQAREKREDETEREVAMHQTEAAHLRDDLRAGIIARINTDG